MKYRRLAKFSLLPLAKNLKAKNISVNSSIPSAEASASSFTDLMDMAASVIPIFSSRNWATTFWSSSRVVPEVGLILTWVIVPISVPHNSIPFTQM